MEVAGYKSNVLKIDVQRFMSRRSRFRVRKANLDRCTGEKCRNCGTVGKSKIGEAAESGLSTQCRMLDLPSLHLDRASSTPRIPICPLP
jgi:hypothetical protein